MTADFRPAVDAVLVVVPAHNEERLLPPCLRSLTAAVDACRESRGIPVIVVVALDTCSDGSAEEVQRWREVHGLTVRASSVGAARAAGVEHAIHELARRQPPVQADRVWVATTDADSQVPRSWLTDQLEWADQGYDVVVGTVSPSPDDIDAALLSAWRDRHVIADGHDSIHGANLGITLSAYGRAGGFRHIAVGEDIALVRSAASRGASAVFTSKPHVVTSGRLTGRAPQGFAHYLTRLQELNRTLEGAGEQV